MVIYIKVIVASFLLKLFYSTNRKDVRGRHHYLNAIQNNQSVILSVWHGQLLSILFDLRNENVYAVAGTHPDAELISKIAKRWGWNMIRGSSKKDGNVAYKEMIRCLSNPGTILFITPDGPAGPPRVPKPGIIRAAQSTSSVIIPISVHSSRRWGFTNWDTFFLEKPFGKIYIEYSAPLVFNKRDSQVECEKRLINSMDKVEKSNLHYTINEKD